MSDQTPLVMPLSAQGVSRTYSEGADTLTVLHEVDFTLNPGECVAVVGSSGSGKSTLLNILGGLDHPSTGEVWVAGQSLQGLDENRRARVRNQHLGFVYQFHHLLPEFTALENVAMPLLLGKDDIGSIEQRAADMLTKVGLGARLKHKPGQLSGGERQRVAIARALVSNPQTVLMDEPTGNLDQTTAEAIQGLILELNESIGIAFVVVTHDLHLAQKMDRMLTLDAGHLKQID